MSKNLREYKLVVVGGGGGRFPFPIFPTSPFALSSTYTYSRVFYFHTAVGKSALTIRFVENKFTTE